MIGPIRQLLIPKKPGCPNNGKRRGIFWKIIKQKPKFMDFGLLRIAESCINRELGPVIYCASKICNMVVTRHDYVGCG